LSVKGLGLTGNDDCFGCLSTVKTELESGNLNRGLIDALEGLKSTYLKSILRPAVKEYINNETSNNRGLKKLYSTALKIENLLEVVQFMNKVHNIED
jgi:hypothetical protein